jgi:hypothetical protein
MDVDSSADASSARTCNISVSDLCIMCSRRRSINMLLELETTSNRSSALKMPFYIASLDTYSKDLICNLRSAQQFNPLQRSSCRCAHQSTAISCLTYKSQIHTKLPSLHLSSVESFMSMTVGSRF